MFTEVPSLFAQLVDVLVGHLGVLRERLAELETLSEGDMSTGGP